MAYHLVGAKQLSEPVMGYFQFQWNSNSFIQANVFWNVVCEMAAISSRPKRVKSVNSNAHVIIYKRPTLFIFMSRGPANTC